MESFNGPERLPRALLVAYACHPNRGSEGGTGWNRAVQAARFCDTSVICEESEFGPAVRRHLAEHGEIPGLRFHFVPQRRWESLLWRIPGLGYVAYNLWQRRALQVALRLHKEQQFDLAHHVNFGTYREPGYLWKLGVPLVWGPFGGTQNFPHRFLGWAGLPGAMGEAIRSLCNGFQLRFSRRVRWAARQATVLLAANSTTQRDFAQVHGVSSLVLADTGITEVTGAASPGRDGKGPLRILWAGQLIPRKALNLLIEALARLPGDVSYELHVVGDGPQRRRWQRLAQRRGIQRHVTWTGWLPHRETLAQYGWADVFAFTSLRDNLGTVILEALGAGLPVLCLDHQGAHDVVTDECGVKIPVSAPEEVISRLTDSLALLARQPELRQRLGRGALRRARKYLWSQEGNKIGAVYWQALARAPARSAPAQRVAPCAAPNGSGHGDRSTRFRRWLASNVAVPLMALGGSLATRQFGILLYHRVVRPEGNLPLPSWSVASGRFRQQMQGLLARGYTPWPLRKVLEHRIAGRPVPSKTFVVSFDDGYECLYHDAWPILKELGIPATVFLTTAYLDSDRCFSFDDWPAKGSDVVPAAWWRSLSTAQCAEMQADGLVELGSHSHRHVDFREHPERFASDVRASLDVLRSRFGVAEAAFAFPFGHSDPALAREAERLGVSCALTSHGTLVAPRRSPFDWGRFVVEDYDTVATLAVKLSGWYTAVQDVWYRWRRTCWGNGGGR